MSFLFFTIFNINTYTPWISSVIIFSAVTLPWIAVVSAVVFIFLHHDQAFLELSQWQRLRRKLSEIVLVFGSTLLAWSFTALLKQLIASPRPFLLFQDINPLFYHGGFNSFPSNHATFFAALATALYMYHPRLGALYYLIALAIGVARVAAGVHFPIDILAGFAIGVLVTYGIFHALMALDLIKKPVARAL